MNDDDINATTGGGGSDRATAPVNWGPTGELVYDRTYSRVKPDGSRETWPETVRRVVDGNLALVDRRHTLPEEREDLILLMEDFKILPGGRHLWASGVKNAQHLFNCWVAGWTDTPSDHFGFTFLRLMEGGGVGANYSNHYLGGYPPVPHDLLVHIVCDPEHQDYEAMRDAGILSTEYDPEWGGAFVIEDSREGWAAALVDLIDTHYRDEVTHYQRVYDVSRVRPAGAKLRTFGGRASGPLPLSQMLVEVCNILSRLAYQGWSLDGLAAMEIDHMIASCVVAGGVRRSARMSMMHWLDPQIQQFMEIKQTSGSHWTTNISVEVDEKFWDGVTKSDPQALDVLTGISEGMVDNGEPGFWDSSLSNVGEPNPVVCTNPCGEITLEPWEPCNLGHVNLAAFVTDAGKTDSLGLVQAHRLMTRFLIRATFSPVADPKSREVLDRNRRIGVGHFGVASYLALRNKRYSDAPSSDFRNVLRELAAVVEDEAQMFSHELRIPVPVKSRTVAPTGTIAKMPGVSEGIHPIFSKYFNRRIRLSWTADYHTISKLTAEGYHVEKDLYDQSGNTYVVTIPTKDTLVQAVADRYGGRVAEDVVESAADLSLSQMLEFQAMYQDAWADNAVSFTANVDPARYPAFGLGQLLREFGGLLKGATIFPEMSMPQAPYERITKEEYDAALVSAVEDGVDLDCASGACPVR